MSLRIIMVPLFDVDADDTALAAAFAIARRFDAHVVGLFVRPDLRSAAPVTGEGRSRTVMGDPVMHVIEAEIVRRRDNARARFEAARAAAGVPCVDAQPGLGSSSTQWREVGGRYEEVIPEEAGLADLVVFGHGEGTPDAVDVRRVAVEAALLGGGRPLLLAPRAPPQRIGYQIAIAWNGSLEAVRALTGAMPFLERAASVSILTAETWRTRAGAGVALAGYLDWHGIAYERQPVEVRGEPVGAAVLRAAGESSADLLVMGGYGRTRLGKMVPGGVTGHVLMHARLPVLMAH
jgi:nucleotide-binding universal stress UspA family protein